MSKYIIASLIGAVIGYITNWLAIKMLFRPYNEVKILGVKMPFTPGLIPKEQKRIAKSVGETIGTHLLSTDTLVDALANDSVKDSVKKWSKKKIEQICNSEATVEEILSKIDPNLNESIKIKLKHISKEKLQEILSKKIKAEINGTKTIKDIANDNIKISIKNYIVDEKANIAFSISNLLKEPSLSEKIKDMIREGVSSNVNPLMAMFINPDAIYEKVVTVVDSNLMKESTQMDITIFLSSLVDRLDYVELRSLLKGVTEEDVNSLIEKLASGLDNEIDIIWNNISEIKVKAILGNKKESIEVFGVSFIVAIFENFINNEAGKVIELLNIEKIVEDQINSFPVDFAEEIIVGIANKELQAITWLGALLGGLIGILSPLLSTFY